MKIQESIDTLIPKVGGSLESVRVHSLTLSCTLGSMKCDSQASYFSCTFTSPCLGCKPKARVAIKKIIGSSDNTGSKF